jgi:hypothetical protein
MTEEHPADPEAPGTGPRLAGRMRARARLRAVRRRAAGMSLATVLATGVREADPPATAGAGGARTPAAVLSPSTVTTSAS